MMASKSFLLAAAFLLTLSSVANAAPSAGDKERARDLMAHGRERRDANDLQGALKAFKDADDVMHVPTTALEVARTQQALGLLMEAQETLVALQKLPQSPSDPRPFAEARQKAALLEKEIAAQVPTIKVVISGTDSKPVVTLDGQVIEATEGPVKVNPGKHTIVGRAAGTEQKVGVTLAVSEQKQVDLRFEPSATPEPPPPAKEERTTSKGVPTISWIGFGVGAAGLIAGSITGVMALSQESDLSSRCPNKQCGRATESDLDGAKTIATISTVGFIVAGVGAAVGVVGLFVGKPAATTKTGSIHFTVDGVAGTF